MIERKAVHYGPVELIPGVVCDGYVLDDGTPVMSERGVASLLGMDQKTLKAVRGNWPPKTLKPFVNKGGIVRGNFVEVVTNKSPHCGRNIVVYTTQTIRTLIHTYASAFLNNGLRKNQTHIGQGAITLSVSLVDTALDTAITEACGLPLNVQTTSQKRYTDIIELMKESGLKCSVNDDIAIKTDITNFLDIPLSTLNGFLSKNKSEIKPIQLDLATIRAISSTASRMNGYNMKDVGTIALSMDSVIGIDLKEKMFGSVSSLTKLDTKGEIEWQQVLAEVFAGLNFHHNYQIGKYRVDFYIKELNLILECNGYDNHANYNQAEEATREKFLNKYRLVRFHHLIDWKTLVNGILRAKVGTVTRLDNVGFAYPQTSKPVAVNVT
jgi:very-short-patch-repair endonuclease